MNLKLSSHAQEVLGAILTTIELGLCIMPQSPIIIIMFSPNINHLAHIIRKNKN
ncbi:unnamed protein product [Moneuplotes crassus]|uniref:Uncharacterized protein n=1 Tax=Euplotes crassus TaxID=5936 RepID=A0AAD1XSY4_EUPCR|nr:unnamed protein product [Moneuplotes crassus]